MQSAAVEVVERFFGALNARDADGMTGLCDEGLELVPLPPEAAGESDPYAGHRGIADLVADLDSGWEELMLTAGEVQGRGGVVLVRGRVHARNRELGLRDIPVAWVFQVRAGRIVSGRAFADIDAAVEAAAESPEAIGEGV